MRGKNKILNMEKMSLAQFISQTREKMGLSQTGLAHKANVPVEMIERIESAQELFLPSTIRQRLAKAFRLSLIDIKKHEKHFDESHKSLDDAIESIRLCILDGIYEGLKCPVCGNSLVAHIEEMYDLEDNLIKHPKARCSKCPFQVK